MSEIQKLYKGLSTSEYISKLCENKDHYIANYIRLTGYNVEDLELVEHRVSATEVAFQMRKKDQSIKDAMLNYEYLKLKADYDAAQLTIRKQALEIELLREQRNEWVPERYKNNLYKNREQLDTEIAEKVSKIV